MRIFTNSVELIEQRAPIPEDRGSALEIVNRVDSEQINGKPREIEHPADLQAGSRREMEHMQEMIALSMAHEKQMSQHVEQMGDGEMKEIISPFRAVDNSTQKVPYLGGNRKCLQTRRHCRVAGCKANERQNLHKLPP